jgi:hypothetical protein
LILIIIANPALEINKQGYGKCEYAILGIKFKCNSAMGRLEVFILAYKKIVILSFLVLGGLLIYE